ncbi:MAG: efflux RND transporter periplasmic adaptor subunit [Dongiaceae bacterium]
MPDIIVTRTERTLAADEPPAPRRGRGRRALLVAGLLAGLAGAAGAWAWPGKEEPAPPPPAPPQVTVGTPLQQTLAPATDFLGQFSAVDSVDLRAQVGGMLAEIAFKDGQLVRKGDLLFVIDPRPFQIRLDQAEAQLQSAEAHAALTKAQLWRAQQLKQSNFGSAETVDQRAADQRGAEAAIAAARAAVRDAALDLEYARVAAPLTGRIGAHLVSAGSVISGSRGASDATTLLATIVSLDPIHLDFDMSEADYLAFRQARRGSAGLGEPVQIDLGGDGRFDRTGTLDFIDNAVHRGSGTIHARATVPNPDLAITPGQFARLRLALGAAAPVLLVPAAAIVPDQSRQIVMTVGPDGTVVPKPVAVGGLQQGLRVILGGLSRTDRVITGGLVRARPGAVVQPVAGSITPQG